jgi:hypothetical protein
MHIPESDKWPTFEVLISAFIASYAGHCSAEFVSGWLLGLKFWHTFQGAPWLGGSLLCVKKGVVKPLPDFSCY